MAESNQSAVLYKEGQGFRNRISDRFFHIDEMIRYCEIDEQEKRRDEPMIAAYSVEQINHQNERVTTHIIVLPVIRSKINLN
jgi:hypothetical protein